MLEEVDLLGLAIRENTQRPFPLKSILFIAAENRCCRPCENTPLRNTCKLQHKRTSCKQFITKNCDSSSGHILNSEVARVPFVAEQRRARIQKQAATQQIEPSLIEKR
jgi:hypothetical protein